MGGCLVRGGCLLSGGVPGTGGVSAPGGVPSGDPPTATAAGGTHPTGIHSCLHFVHNQLNHKQERIQKLGAGKPRNMKSMGPSIQDQLGP